MSNKNYIKGRTFEYAIMRHLEKKGYVCMRTAGSHGVADVIAFDQKYGGMDLIIQAKAGKSFDKKELEKLVSFKCYARKELWFKKDRAKMVTVYQIMNHMITEKEVKL